MVTQARPGPRHPCKCMSDLTHSHVSIARLLTNGRSNAYVPRSLVEENNYERTNPDTRRYPQSGPSKHHAAYAQRSPQYHRRARSSTHSFGQPTVRPDNWVSEQDGPSRQRGAREGPRQLPAFGQNLEAVQSMSDRATEPPGSPGEQSFIALDKCEFHLGQGSSMQTS